MNRKEETFIGQRESVSLEFNLEEAKDDSILETIVAFLNTSGGRLVIGVKAPGPADFAIEEVGVREPHYRRDAIEKMVRDRIERRPGNMVGARVERSDEGRAFVVVDVEKSDIGPHALRYPHRGGYAFFVREGSSNRALQVVEIIDFVKKSLGFESSEEETTAIQTARERFNRRIVSCARAASDGAAALFVGFVPSSVEVLGEQEWLKRRKETAAIFKSEQPLGQRRDGFGFGGWWPHFQPEESGDEVLFGKDHPLLTAAGIRRDGTVWGARKIENVYHGLHEKTPKMLKIPDVLFVEFVASVAKLASRVFRELKAKNEVHILAHFISSLPIVVLGPPNTLDVRGMMQMESGGVKCSDIPPFHIVGDAESLVANGDSDEAIQDLLARLFDLLHKPDGWRRYWTGTGFRFS